jgi:hypothetical protein
MRKIIYIVTFLIATNHSFSQTEETIKSIRLYVEAINKDTSYKITTLPNGFFVKKKNEVYDNGQELKAVYKDRQLKKLIYSVGLSYSMKTFEYYFLKNDLIFVFEKEDNFPEIKDKSGESIGLDYTKLEPAFEGRYYFENDKIIQTNIKGQKRVPDNQNDSKEKMFIGNIKIFLEYLQDSKSN